MSEPLPDPDRAPGAPHPRETLHLFGQARAEAEFLAAHSGGRMHHAWLIAGPRGVGKATLAWRIARFLLALPQDSGGLFGGAAPPPPDSLDTDPDHPVVRRILAQAEPRLFLLRRGANATGSGLAANILVDEVRKLKSFLQLSAADGGRRAVIVDAADEMNTPAANALLKLLEEPPAGVTFLLVSHQPMRLLPTIRSRCRTLRLDMLGPAEMARALEQTGVAAAPDEAPALAALSGGSVGAAVRLVELQGLDLYGQIVALLGGLPRMDRPRAIALAEGCAGKANAETFELMLDLIDLALSRLARAGAAGGIDPEAAPDEARIFARLSPDTAAARGWANLQQELSARSRHGRAVNLDPAALVLDMFLAIAAASGAASRRTPA
ncbi:DNA polymerase III subunit delta' [Phaeovulum vinaykumarii]|uniref:DNA polymerase-3 subunit delta n=1 Tax=Phaeovulum vinaykumarii TaxID=407234 RepID=A0A1N7MGV3_9RHOB|nr:DNA polymerase III subunit delta' [Phaeovulum vinaykumarii]SIS85268.1 DNA polymerase-3 subunit delta' [Phaeovulum vinaykumarii]SOC12170.1 DNA polymerase-3 subunit delta' [Phaeovulum vinaykumarii]